MMTNTVVSWKIFITYVLSIFVKTNMTECAVYYVRSIENQSNICSQQYQQCCTFQQYLNSAEQYLTSDVQFFFQRGEHYLHKEVLIKNLHNFSMIGDIDAAGVQFSLIFCKNGSGITIINSSNILISNLKIFNCNSNVVEHTKLPNIQIMWYEEAQIIDTAASLLLVNCISIKLIEVNVESGLVGLNLGGDSFISGLHSSGLELVYMEDSILTNTTFNILEFHLLNRYVDGVRYTKEYPIKILVTNLYHGAVNINF